MYPIREAVQMPHTKCQQIILTGKHCSCRLRRDVMAFGQTGQRVEGGPLFIGVDVLTSINTNNITREANIIL